jgi:DNA end-binding protein Ku
MATSVWKGQISFGMVSFPVKLCAAARTQAVRFHQLHPCASTSRIKQVLYCRAEDKPVPRADLVKGFEYDRDRYVVVEEHELRRLAPPSSRVMEVREFVPAAELDPVYLDASYYVAPQEGGEKPYALLFEALRRSCYVALAQWTLQHREHLVVLRPGRWGLLAHTLFYREEVRATEEFRTDTGQLSGQELELAHLLVNALAAPFDPGKYQDRYRASLRALIDSKIQAQERKPGAPRALGPARDILHALQASLHAKQGAAGPPGRKGPRQAIREAAHSKQAPAPSLVPPKNPRVLAR